MLGNIHSFQIKQINTNLYIPDTSIIFRDCSIFSQNNHNNLIVHVHLDNVADLKPKKQNQQIKFLEKRIKRMQKNKKDGLRRKAENNLQNFWNRQNYCIEMHKSTSSSAKQRFSIQNTSLFDQQYYKMIPLTYKQENDQAVRMKRKLNSAYMQSRENVIKNRRTNSWFGSYK